ncbi:uncharacterized protein MYCGRDRAFT_97936 [Zymoseptoria tritici IPO323]|uniref:Uncharacterized protein n=1 Tax=Zymoseptoria tritici (strain CBS 115943 / IPO323) TaxID=336722 RepID=F9XRU3_ZYMTI|nr:uncharacterized protein MYCGRDRAFT_97936 [Zymoseptoria tritici IPO323]EGP81975.1 hypothetical protein MYCGRDRAFT_97936 [Zymoseptoria tritici IPO323]
MELLQSFLLSQSLASSRLLSESAIRSRPTFPAAIRNIPWHLNSTIDPNFASNPDFTYYHDLTYDFGLLNHAAKMAPLSCPGLERGVLESKRRVSIASKLNAKGSGT